MRSRADLFRAIETGWRVLALAMLAWAIYSAFRAPAHAPERVTGDALAAVLPRLTRAAVPAAVDVSFSSAPAAEARAWLSALRRAGDRISWRAAAEIPPLAVEVLPRADPSGGVRALAAASRGARVRLDDGAGPLDTLTMSASAESRSLPAFVSPLTAREGAQPARAALHDTLAPRRVLILGRAEWEGKFVLAALEERGWHASARFGVAPGIVVSQGASHSLDTARFSVVIALDSASAALNARAIAGFVRQGGGLILAGDAARAAALTALAPGSSGARVRPASLVFADSAPRRALGFYAITSLKGDAIPLESRDAHVAVAARRAGMGRVVQLGYDETWRWRLTGPTGAPEAHRAWWAAIVSSASYRPVVPLPHSSNSDAAPLAQLYSALGMPSAERRAPSPAVPVLPWWMLTVMILSLLAEITSRRLRGAP
jgi:hypothetical protein